MEVDVSIQLKLSVLDEAELGEFLRSLRDFVYNRVDDIPAVSWSRRGFDRYKVDTNAW